MIRSEVHNIIHTANYAALCIAILRPAPITIEDAFELYEGVGTLIGGQNNMTIIDWMMAYPYLTAIIIVYTGVILVTTKVEISIRIGEKKEPRAGRTEDGKDNL